MDFVAIDVETANRSVASICQVGVAVYSGGAVVRQWSSYVDPEDRFEAMNISIHGISPRTVAGAPTWPGISPVLYELLAGRVVVSHSSFNRTALGRAAARYGQRLPECTWLDSAVVARHTWKDLKGNGGYGLGTVCAALGFSFAHHDALADAIASGHIVCAAIRHTGLTLDQWLAALVKPARRRPLTSQRRA